MNSRLKICKPSLTIKEDQSLEREKTLFLMSFYICSCCLSSPAFYLCYISSPALLPYYSAFDHFLIHCALHQVSCRQQKFAGHESGSRNDWLRLLTACSRSQDPRFENALVFAVVSFLLASVRRAQDNREPQLCES